MYRSLSLLLLILSCCYIINNGIEIPFDVLECFESNTCGVTSIGSYNFSMNTENDERRVGHIFQIKNGLSYDTYFYWDIIKMAGGGGTTENSGGGRKNKQHINWETENHQELKQIFVPAYTSIYLDTMMEDSHILRLFVRLQEEETNEEEENNEEDEEQKSNKNITDIKSNDDQTIDHHITSPPKVNENVAVEGTGIKTNVGKKLVHVSVGKTSSSSSKSKKRKMTYDYEVIDKAIGQKEKKIASGKLSYNCDFFYKMCYFMLKYQKSKTQPLPRCQDGTYESICSLDDKNRDAKPQSDIACINTCMSTYFSHIVDEKPEQFDNEVSTLEKKNLLTKNDLLHCFFFSMVERQNHVKGTFSSSSSSPSTNSIVGNEKPFSKNDIQTLIKEDAKLANFLNDLDTFSATSVCADTSGWQTATIILSILLSLILIIVLSFWFSNLCCFSSSNTTIDGGGSGSSTRTSWWPTGKTKDKVKSNNDFPYLKDQRI